MRGETEILEEGFFYAGVEKRIPWGWRVLRYPTGDVGVVLMRVGRRKVTISFNMLELPDLLKALKKIKARNFGERNEERGTA